MTRPRKQPGRHTPKDRNVGKILQREKDPGLLQPPSAMLQRVRSRYCIDPDCPETGTRHKEELCDECSRIEGRPIWHLAE